MIMFDNVKKIIQTDVGKRKIKCCPQCGSFKLRFINNGFSTSGIVCDSCGYGIGLTKVVSYFTDEELFDLWNKETRK